MPLKVVRNDIVKIETDAIVSTDCSEASVTPGLNTAAKYVIHAGSTVSDTGNSDGEEELRSCYRNSLEIALENGIRSIAFPVTAGAPLHFSLEEVMRIAIDEISSFLVEHEMLVYLAVNSKPVGNDEKLYPDLDSYIDRNYVSDKRVEYGDGYPGPLPEAAFQITECSASCMMPVGNQDYTKLSEGKQEKKKEKKGIFSAFMQIGKKSEAVRKERQGKGKSSENKEFLQNRVEADYDITDGAADDSSDDLQSREFNFDDQECLDELDRKLKERMSHMSDSFSTYLLYLIKSKGMENAEVYNRALVDKKLFSKIKNNVDYHPKKMTVLCLCVGAKLSLDESKDLLARAGYALSPCDKQDIIFSYFIENQIYDMIELDIQLEEHGLEPIIA